MEVIVPTILYTILCYAILYTILYYTILQVLVFHLYSIRSLRMATFFAARKLHFEGFVRVFWGQGLGEEALQRDRIRAHYTLNT